MKVAFNKLLFFYYDSSVVVLSVAMSVLDSKSTIYIIISPYSNYNFLILDKGENDYFDIFDISNFEF